MASVFIIGTRKFFPEIKNIARLFRENGFEVFTPEEDIDVSEKIETVEGQKKALLSSFEIMKKIDIVYVFAKDGHAGQTVSMEILYAFLKNKKIISSEKIEKISVRSIISEVLSPVDFVRKYEN